MNAKKTRPRVKPGQDTRMLTLRIGADVYAMLRAHTTAEEQREALYQLAYGNYRDWLAYVSHMEIKK